MKFWRATRTTLAPGCQHSNSIRLALARSRDGYSRPRIFFRHERERGRGPGSREGGAAGAWAFVADSRETAETTLVQASVALARRLRSNHRHTKAPVLDVASHLQRGSWIQALCRLERDYEKSVLHRPLAGAQKEEEQCSGRVNPTPSDVSC